METDNPQLSRAEIRDDLVGLGARSINTIPIQTFILNPDVIRA